MRTTYRIEYWQDHPKLQRWAIWGQFNYMPKSFAEGAFAVLRSLNGGGKRYRLVTDSGTVVQEHNTGIIQAN